MFKYIAAIKGQHSVSGEAAGQHTLRPWDLYANSLAFPVSFIPLVGPPSDLCVLSVVKVVSEVLI